MLVKLADQALARGARAFGRRMICVGVTQRPRGGRVYGQEIAMLVYYLNRRRMSDKAKKQKNQDARQRRNAAISCSCGLTGHVTSAYDKVLQNEDYKLPFASVSNRVPATRVQSTEAPKTRPIFQC
jgi:hypothetical protein